MSQTERARDALLAPWPRELPTGRAASTHIIKPGIRGLEKGALNEHLSLTAASHCDLRAAPSNVMAFGDQQAIAVTRYDRDTDRRTGARLAPVYNVASALSNPDLNTARTMLAMSFSGHDRVNEIEPRHIAEEAGEAVLDPTWTVDRARELAAAAPDAYVQAAADAHLDGTDAEFAAHIIDAAADRAQSLKAQLDQYVPDGTATHRAGRSVPPRLSRRRGVDRGDSERAADDGNRDGFAARRTGWRATRDE